VANEVKELAKETARATEEISQKIDAIQTDTTAAVKAIAEVTHIITQVNDISNVIASAVEEQTATTAEIGRNVTEAAMGSSEIASSIAGVAHSAELTMSGASQTQTAARSLSEMAAQLQKLAASGRA
jgi:methyl-accepting chemotaxis protein